MDIEKLKRDAAAGDAESQYRLAMRHIYGDGVEEDNDKATKLLNTSAAQGHIEAMYNLAICYHYGYGTKVDLQQAFEWYLKAAEGGYGKGMQLAGEFLADGRHGAQDDCEAVKWYRKAMESTDPDAWCYSRCLLAACYEYGRGVEQNMDRAKALMAEAAAGGEKRLQGAKKHAAAIYK